MLIATQNYQAEQDVIAEYLADRCKREAAARVPRNDLFNDYLAYCVTQADKHPLNRTAFFDRIRRTQGVGEGQPRICGVPTRVFTGLRLMTIADRPDDDGVAADETAQQDETPEYV